MRAIVLLLTLPAALSACKNEPSADASPTASAAVEAEPGWTRYGAAFANAERVSLRKVLAEPGNFAGKTVYVEGDVRRACARKGCWMELAESGDESSPACRVTFKDYGFFVPLDSAGSRARLEAQVQLEEVKAAHVEHLEEEGAKFSEKNPDGTAKEVRLVATAVELKR